MSAGSALLVISENDNELTHTVIASGCGLQVKTNQPGALAEAILDLADNKRRLKNMKSASRMYCLEYHQREACTNNFVQIVCEGGRNERP